jgi:hypothetical protein
MADPLAGSKVTIKGKERTLKFTMGALRLAQRHLGGRPVQQVVETLAMDVDAVCHLTAAGLYGSEGETSKTTAKKVEQWLDEEPTLFVPLVKAILEGVIEAYRRMTPPDEPEPGEATAPKG